MNNNKKHWIYSFDKDKNISFAIASVLNAYYEKNFSFAKNIEAIKVVHNLTWKQAETVILKAKEYIKGESHEQKEKSKSA